MSMRVQMLDTGNVYDYEDSYALRLIEQGKAILVSGDTPPTPEPTPIDPSQYSAEITALQSRCLALETEISAMKSEATDTNVFANLYQSVAQAQERMLEYTEEHLQEEIDAMAGENEGA